MQLIINATHLFKSFCLFHEFFSKVYSLLNFHWYFVSQHNELTHLSHQSNQAWIIVYIHQLTLVKLNNWFISSQAANMDTNLLNILHNLKHSISLLFWRWRQYAHNMLLHNTDNELWCCSIITQKNTIYTTDFYDSVHYELLELTSLSAVDHMTDKAN